jgi:hypothetical protein
MERLLIDFMENMNENYFPANASYILANDKIEGMNIAQRRRESMNAGLPENGAEGRKVML